NAAAWFARPERQAPLPRLKVPALPQLEAPAPLRPRARQVPRRRAARLQPPQETRPPRLLLDPKPLLLQPHGQRHLPPPQAQPPAPPVQGKTARLSCSSSRRSSRCLLCAFVADGQDACDLALRQLQARGIVEGARRSLEAEVEELLAPIVQGRLELLVVHIAHVSR